MIRVSRGGEVMLTKLVNVSDVPNEVAINSADILRNKSSIYIY